MMQGFVDKTIAVASDSHGRFNGVLWLQAQDNESACLSGWKEKYLWLAEARHTFISCCYYAAASAAPHRRPCYGVFRGDRLH
nr:hypothetical protein CFP56_72058 [Quercus suber]